MHSLFLIALAATPNASILKDLATGPSDHSDATVESSARVGEVFYFTALGRLWRSEGTEASTTLLSANAAQPELLTVQGSTLYFTANDPAFGTELWKSDGTRAGTVMVKDITPGSAGTAFNFMLATSTRVYFLAVTPDEGSELWQSDGSPKARSPWCSIQA